MSTLQGCNDYSAKIYFIPNPDFERALSDTTLAESFLGPMPKSSAEAQGVRAAASKELSPYFNVLYETPLLTHEQEIHLFRKMNFLKYRASVLRDGHPNPSEETLSQFKHLLEQAYEIQGQIVKANLRLVVSIAKKQDTERNPLPELISDGHVWLLELVQRFDFARGYKFSTYAKKAIRENFQRSISQEREHQCRFRTDTIFGDGSSYDFLTSLSDRVTDEWIMMIQQREAADHINTLLACLDRRSRAIIEMRFGLNGESKLTLEEIGKMFKISGAHVWTIETRALARMKKREELRLNSRRGRQTTAMRSDPIASPNAKKSRVDSRRGRRRSKALIDSLAKLNLKFD